MCSQGRYEFSGAHHKSKTRHRWAVLSTILILYLLENMLPSMPSSNEATIYLAVPRKRPSCLVVVIGGIRAHQLTWSSFKASLLDAFGCDLAICTSTKPNSTHSDPFMAQAKYTWLYTQPTDWAEALNFAATTEGGVGDSWRPILRLRGILFGGIQDHALEGTSQSSASIVMFYRWFLLHCMRREGVDTLYDRFIITRSDYLYEVAHPPLEALDPQYIWSPAGEDWGGITDRHTVVSAVDLETVLTPLRTLLADPGPLYEVLKQDESWNLEKFIAFHFFNAGILHRMRRFPPCMYTVRGKDDPAYWPTGHWSDELGLHLKYPDEYEKTQRTKIMLGNGSWSTYILQYGLNVSRYGFLPIYNPMSGQNWPYRTEFVI